MNQKRVNFIIEKPEAGAVAGGEDPVAAGKPGG
jgi:hypothetical protein